ncbi:MAG: hypothetical protein V1701_10060 [Planctomycetota bacterium]
MAKETSIGGDNCRFRKTLWTSILRAKDKSAPGYRSSLTYLISAYWKPVYFYIRRKGYDIDAAKNLTQSFFTVFIEKEFMKSVERERGRFRTFILAALNHFLSKERERLEAQKRGGGQSLLSLDFKRAETEISLEPASAETPEKTLIRAWAQSILKLASDNLRREFKKKSRQIFIDMFDAYLAAKTSDRAENYKALASQFGVTETDIRNYLHRIRRRYKELIEEEIGKYVTTKEAVQEELKELFSAFSNNY